MAIGKDIIAGTVPSEKSVKLFEGIIAKAYQDVLAEFDGADLANKARRAAIVKQLNIIAAETHMDLHAWAVTQIPAFYEAGAFEAGKDLVKGGQVVDMYKNFATIHKEAIASLVNETSADIASAMQGFSKMTQRMINQATRDALLTQVATGKITGESHKEIAKGIVSELKKNGMTAITDKAGKNWDLANYGKMLARTKLTQAHNSGVMMRLAAEGNDLVIVSDHISACPLCQPWENKVLSVSGNSKEYPSLATAQGDGLFHPNCRHAISPLPNDQEYLNNSKVWDANQQKYVDFNGLNNARGVGATPYGKEYTVGKDAKVWRAVDSTDKQSTMGIGTYFGFDKANVVRYGSNVQAFQLKEGSKMLQLADYDAAMKFAEEARKADPKAWMAMMEKYGENDGLGHVITAYAQKLGYDGIIGDDAIFGSVVFKADMLKQLNAAGMYDVTKASVTKEFAKVNGKDLPLTDFHAGFMQDRGIGFVVDERSRAKSRNGYFNYMSNEITLNKGALQTRNGQHTFFHELGHAIDFRYTETAAREISSDAWRGIDYSEKLGVAKTRLVKSFEKTIKAENLTDADMDLIWNGGKIKKDITVMRKGVEMKAQQIIGVTNSHLKYLRSNEEIFADGYAQYTLDPKAFKKLAPSMFDYFENLTKNYAK